MHNCFGAKYRTPYEKEQWLYFLQINNKKLIFDNGTQTQSSFRRINMFVFCKLNRKEYVT